MDTKSNEEKGFGVLLDKMNNINHDNYFSLMHEIGKVLDVPEKADIVYIEAMLIEATKRRYQDTIKAEVVLVKFGLLDGYYQYKCNLLCEGHSDMSPTRKCHIKFLKESNYMRDYNGKYKSYEEAEEAKKVDSVIDTLKKAEKRYIREVANKLYSNRQDIYNCISEHVDSFIIKFKVGDELKKIPKLPHVKENNHKSSSQSRSDEPDNPAKSYDENTESEKTTEADYSGTQSNVTIIYDNKTYQEITINNAETNQDVKIDNTEINPEINIDIHEEGDTGGIDKVDGSKSKVTGKLKPIVLFFMTVLVGFIIALVCWCVPRILNKPADAETIMGNYYPAVSGWNDNYNKDGGRPNYSTSQVEAGALDNEAVFNSLSDNEQFDGNENYFIRACEYDESNQTPIWQAGNITIKDGQEYLVRLYIHNNSPRIAAKDVKTFFSIGNASNKTVSVTGFIKSSNANPTEYSSTFIFNSDTAFCLEYIPNSATLLNQGIGDGGIFLGDQIVSDDSGTLIGYNALDGIIPGGIKYASYVTIRVKAVVVMDYEIEQQVRLAGTKEWIPDEITAEVGDKVEFQLQYKNTAENDIVHRDVMVGATLPDSLKYVPGSTRLWNELHDGDRIVQDTIITTGINIGHYSSGANAYVRFTAEVVDENLAKGSNVLVTWGRTTVAKFILQDSARVRVENGKPTDNKIVLVAPICILSLLIIAIIATLIMLLRKSKQPK